MHPSGEQAKQTQNIDEAKAQRRWQSGLKAEGADYLLALRPYGCLP
jgi:hypothetical protein